MEIKLNLQQARSDVEIGPVRAHGNRLWVCRGDVVVVVGLGQGTSTRRQQTRAK